MTSTPSLSLDTAKPVLPEHELLALVLGGQDKPPLSPITSDQAKDHAIDDMALSSESESEEDESSSSDSDSDEEKEDREVRIERVRTTS